MKALVSYVSKRKIENFISKYPVVKEIGIGERGIFEMQELALVKKTIPFTGLLKCVHTYLNCIPVKTIKANGTEYLMYEDNEFSNMLVNSAIRNNE